MEGNGATTNMKPKSYLLSLFFVAFAVFTAPGQSAFECFLRLDTVPGNAQNSFHRDEIVVLAFSSGITNAAGAARPTFQDLTVLKPVDRATPLLALKAARGESINEAILTCRQVASPNAIIYQLRLTDVVVSSTRTTGDALQNVLLEEVTLRYGTIRWEVTPVLPDGRPLAPVRSGFDVTNNRAL